jgi:hypothetical protein
MVRSAYLSFLESTSLADIADTVPSGGTVLNVAAQDGTTSAPARGRGR